MYGFFEKPLLLVDILITKFSIYFHTFVMLVNCYYNAQRLVFIVEFSLCFILYFTTWLFLKTLGSLQTLYWK